MTDEVKICKNDCDHHGVDGIKVWGGLDDSQILGGGASTLLAFKGSCRRLAPLRQPRIVVVSS